MNGEGQGATDTSSSSDDENTLGVVDGRHRKGRKDRKAQVTVAVESGRAGQGMSALNGRQERVIYTAADVYWTEEM